MGRTSSARAPFPNSLCGRDFRIALFLRSRPTLKASYTVTMLARQRIKRTGVTLPYNKFPFFECMLFLILNQDFN
jgi:hypothetical protein